VLEIFTRNTLGDDNTPTGGYGTAAMTMLEIKPGEKYMVVNPTDGTPLCVTVVEPAKWVLDHWSCLTNDGKKLLVHPDDFLSADTNPPPTES
jgi:hypothetical protein